MDKPLISEIRRVLQDKMNHPHMAAFHDNARLNEDLCLDSLLTLHLILLLELDLGVEIPDDQLTQADFDTVGSLARFLSGLQIKAVGTSV
ncbi:phosphopantetheine-binding protein [Allohahella marinimesophila]|uniref:Carrier domain-containing protein n=1 Tax=Allohahella marinimesophila TaxID=1054972 RepID=A0ABP7NX03_9GAMM